MQQNAEISKIRRASVLKVYFLKLHKCVYLRAKFQVSSIILTSFRQGISLPRLGLKEEFQENLDGELEAKQVKSASTRMASLFALKICTEFHETLLYKIVFAFSVIVSCSLFLKE